MTLCVVRRNRGIDLHWQMGEIVVGIGLVLWWVLIISFRILLELGKKHRSFATLIFAWFGCLKSPKSLETRRFSGYCNFSYLPSNSVKFGFGNLTRNFLKSWLFAPLKKPVNTGFSPVRKLNILLFFPSVLSKSFRKKCGITYTESCPSGRRCSTRNRGRYTVAPWPESLDFMGFFGYS